MTSTDLPGLAPRPSLAGPAVTVASVLRTLSKERLVDLARDHGLRLNPRDTLAALAREVERTRALSLSALLARLLRDELKKALTAHELDPEGRGRAELADRLLAHSGEAPADAPSDLPADPFAPARGPLAVVRQRQYVITDVVPPRSPATPPPRAPPSSSASSASTTTPRAAPSRSSGPSSSAPASSSPPPRASASSPPSTTPPGSAPTSTPSAGAPSRPPTPASSSPPSAPASSS